MSSKAMERMILQPYRWFLRICNGAQSPLLLLVRLYWGWQFMQTGWGKLHNLPHVTEFFASLGIPAPGLNALFVSYVELIGGVLLILGLASRLTGLVLTVDMLVAYVTADREALLSVFSDPGKFYGAAPYTFLFASLLVLVFGPGRIALDTLIARYTAHTDTTPEREGGRDVHPGQQSAA